MTTAKITSSAPVLLVKDVAKSAAYWRDKLGFTHQETFGNRRILRWSSVIITR